MIRIHSDATFPRTSPKRVLIVTRNLPPLLGGMETLLQNTALELNREFDVSVVGPRGCRHVLPGIRVIREVSTNPLLCFFVRCFISTVILAVRLKPHIIFAGSGITAPIALHVARFISATSITQLHGLDLVAHSSVYRQLFVRTFRRLDGIIVNSHNTASLAARASIPGNRTFVVNPGIKPPEPDKKNASKIESLLSSYKFEDKRILLSVGRITTRKGLSQFIERSLPTVVNKHPDTVLVIVGSPPSQALRSETTEMSRMKYAIDSSGLEKHVYLLGSLSDKQCDLWYRAADVFVFPGVSVFGDVEGFGLVAIEAAARGLPTVAFSVGGIPDAIAHGVSGYLVKEASYDEFAHRVLQLLSKDASISPDSCRNYASSFYLDSFGTRIRSALDNMS